MKYMINVYEGNWNYVGTLKVFDTFKEARNYKYDIQDKLKEKWPEAYVKIEKTYESLDEMFND